MNIAKSSSRETISDFGTQWTRYTRSSGLHGSVETLDGLFGPLLDKRDVADKRVADVGAGNGRYTLMFHQLGAERVLALEPSDGMATLKCNTQHLERIDYLQAPADAIPDENFDFVFCIGVLQFIPDPQPSLRAMGRALGPNGRLFVWVYGQENNGLYLAFVRPLRWITCRLPHAALNALSALLLLPADLYSWLSRFLPLPLGNYLRNYFSKLDRYSRKLVIYDQLNPKTARYYRKEDLEKLFEECGFTDVRMHHHLGYSWSVLARYQGKAP